MADKVAVCGQSTVVQIPLDLLDQLDRRVGIGVTRQALGLEASLALGRHLSVWVSARARLNLILETVTIRGEPTVRVGRVSAPATAGVSFHWPL